MPSQPTLPIDPRVHQLSREHKIALLSGQNYWQMQGVPALDLPAVILTDGPHGLRKQHSNDDISLVNNVASTCFPTASALASSWDPELVATVAAAIGQEARAEGVSVVLGPGVNIKRSPLGGRNFEYFSEDPHLSGILATRYIQGMQSTGVGASLKHFAANNQEYRRMTINAVVDERALHEIYLASFEQPVIESQPWTVMCAYNSVNGTLASQNPHLLTQILRNNWGYRGAIISDWGAVCDRVAALQAGLDLEMPGNANAHAARIADALRAGTIGAATIDQSVSRLLTLLSQVKPAFDAPSPYDTSAHHQLARRAGAESIVLLKNATDLLPLKPLQRVALIGTFAQQPRFQGAGSSRITPTRLDTLAAVLEERGIAFTYAPGYTQRSNDTDQNLLEQAVALAHNADVAVLCIGLPDIAETEGLDRLHMRLPDSHNELVHAIVHANPNVVVVLSNGAPVEMPWHNAVPTILETYLSGQATGSAIADVLDGTINPSGKLAETFPKQWQDHPAHLSFPGTPYDVEYRESLYVGYRYYDTATVPVLFPFGHGLSYTTFHFDNLRVPDESLNPDDGVSFAIDITNTGTLPGAEVVQIYLHDVSSTLFRPDQELKAFRKIFLAPGERTTLMFHLPRRAFAAYDDRVGAWLVESGAFEVRVGASSRDIRCHAMVYIASADVIAPHNNPALAPYYDPSSQAITPEAFHALLGFEPIPSIPKRGNYTINTPIVDMHASVIGRFIHRLLKRQLRAMTHPDPGGPTELLFASAAEEIPLRIAMTFSKGVITLDHIEWLLAIINGNFGEAVRRIPSLFRRNHPYRHPTLPISPTT